MSEIQYSALYIVRKSKYGNPVNFFDARGQEVSKLLTFDKNGLILNKGILITAQDNWFARRMEILVRESGIEELKFLTGESHTHRHVQSIESGGTVVREEIDYMTLLSPLYDDVLSAIDRLRLWCLTATGTAAKILDIQQEDLIALIGSPSGTVDRPGNCCSKPIKAEFLFRILAKMDQLIQDAKAQRSFTAYCVRLRRPAGPFLNRG